MSFTDNMVKYMPKFFEVSGLFKDADTDLITSTLTAITVFLRTETTWQPPSIIADKESDLKQLGKIFKKAGVTTSKSLEETVQALQVYAIWIKYVIVASKSAEEGTVRINYADEIHSVGAVVLSSEGVDTIAKILRQA